MATRDGGRADDPVALTRALIRCPSVTPEDAGALGLVATALEGLGFECRRLRFSEPGTPDIDNLYARRGGAQPNFCFAGHTDVVPAGNAAAWSSEPFEAALRDDVIFGRGAADMKGAIACFIAATARYLAATGGEVTGSISLLITGDEEGPAINGTRKALAWMAERGETIDACLTGEPTNPTALGEMIKIGRRGSLNGWLTVPGVQGHVGYPHLADNPIPRLMAMLRAITETPLDDGTEHFEASNLEITTLEVGNEAIGLIPAEARARFNIRFNDRHDSVALERWLRERLDATGGAYGLDIKVSGEAFLTPPGPLSKLVAGAVAKVTGRMPEFSTTGGTSDSRFIKDYCPVLDFGLVGQTMHKVDEQVPVADLEQLTEIYRTVLERYFTA
jgi:succinyl-diaminopimelate desuccinylase